VVVEAPPSLDVRAMKGREGNYAVPLGRSRENAILLRVGGYQRVLNGKRKSML
jgi:hypothetical protein